MIYAFIGIICAFFLFLLVSFFLTAKNVELKLENSTVKVQTRGSRMKIFINDSLYKEIYAPPLIYGETYRITVNEQEYDLYCHSSGFGYKLRVEIKKDDKVLVDNGVTIKEKAKKN